MRRYLLRWSPCGFLVLFCLVNLTLGCGKGKRAVDHIDVSGQVTYKKAPVTGGRITFVSDDGFTATGRIDEEGNYQIKSPVGNVKITVDTGMLDKSNRGAKFGTKGAGRPGEDPDPIKGTFVRIPPKYKNTETTDLNEKVSKDHAKIDLELKD
jgi:hypothetical protein